MDRGQFDTLAKLVWSKRSRRAALATLLGAALLGRVPAPLLAKGEGQHKAADPCYPSTRCTPGKDKNLSRCDFAFSTVFRNLNVHGANLSHSNFAGADLRGADFHGANLSGGCFASADLSGAKLGAGVNLHKAVFCNTTMPDGTIDDSGCEGTTPCCHLRTQDCQDSSFSCYTLDQEGVCEHNPGSFVVGTCWTFPVCCPCEHRFDQAFWNEQCQLHFPQGCRGQCQAEFDGANGCHEGFICP